MEIPQIEKNGSDGSQENSTIVNVQDLVLTPFPVHNALSGLASTNSNELGGVVAARLVASSFAQLSYELSETKKENKSLNERLEEYRSKYENSRVENECIKSKVREYESDKNRRGILIMAGTAIAGFGVDRLSSSDIGLGVSLVLIGIIMCASGWLFGNSGGLK